MRTNSTLGVGMSLASRGSPSRRAAADCAYLNLGAEKGPRKESPVYVRRLRIAGMGYHLERQRSRALRASCPGRRVVCFGGCRRRGLWDCGRRGRIRSKQILALTQEIGNSRLLVLMTGSLGYTRGSFVLHAHVVAHAWT
ncbi:unnamed protein product [Periconia digitata]|uniref:Uncharacterized protein n=1 Tax=Periconia digitata TaxID=1303443 RepID=A0A9W4UMY7_9PLEO|nr:unnamed protein product [Periconia digitata]